MKTEPGRASKPPVPANASPVNQQGLTLVPDVVGIPGAGSPLVVLSFSRVSGRVCGSAVQRRFVVEGP